MRIIFLVFPDFQQLDLDGPHEVFAAAGDIDIDLVWKTDSPVISSIGGSVAPTRLISDVRDTDVFCIPGGIGVNRLLRDTAVLEYVRHQSARSKFITSVCTGALVLGAAGLLEGKRATTHWASLDLLPLLGAKPTKERVVRDGNVFTAAGVTAGIDFALAILSQLRSPEEAMAVQLSLEYAPQPPFDSGRPETATKQVFERVKEEFAELRNQRELIIADVVHKWATRSCEMKTLL